MMRYTLINSSNTPEIIKLFIDVFSMSEDPSEGKNIGDLVSNLLNTTESNNLIGCVALDKDETIIGCILFTRFILPSDQLAFILSPVAIASGIQGSGVGQTLINYGLDHLRSLGVNLVLTYGDPAFYSKTGFEQISENIIRAPFILSQPIGWLAQSLDGKKIERIEGETACVKALSDQKYW